MAPESITEPEVYPAETTPPDPHRALPASTSASTPPADPGKPASRGGSARKWIILLVVLAAVALDVWRIRGNNRESAAEAQKSVAAADRPIPVLTSPVAQRSMPIYLTALGTVTAYNTVTIKSRVDGQLLRVLVREGQAVKQGQLLMEIDPRPYQAALAQAEGQLTKDQANARNADAEAQRYTALFQAGVVSKESQQSQVSSAGQATGSIQADQAAIEAARVNLNYTRITSPINGIVGLRQVDAGNIVHAADTNGLIVVTQVQPISVIFTLPEDQLPDVLKRTRSGQHLPVEAFDRSETTHLASGSLLTLDNQIDTTTGTDKVKAVFDNKDGALFPNQFVNVRLILQQRPNSLVVPASAIQTGSQGNFVYVVKPGDPPADQQRANRSAAASSANTKSSKPPKAKSGAAPDAAAGPAANQPHFFVEAQTVKIAVTEGSQVILDSGVAPGDQLVIDGQEKLRAGSRVLPHASKTNVSGSAGNGSTDLPGTASGPASISAGSDSRRQRSSSSTTPTNSGTSQP